MTRIDRPAVAGALAGILLPGTLLLAAPAAHAESQPRPNKAYVEYLERLQLDGEHRTKAQIEHDEQQRWTAHADSMERAWRDSQRQGIARSRDRAFADCLERLGQHPSKAQIEHCEQLAQGPKPQPAVDQQPEAEVEGLAPEWPLAVGALLAAAAAGGITARVRRRRRQQPSAAR
jgi:hypothetical protein